ncbi:Dihydroneopterin triphosphate diphosphatase [Trema orientale]|uniref:Dihydroneopterin triphosphate diphosphatase n=1 Tax=Trema orientale TaxID=63057 RepID=A0A2P5FMR7_TREOI|nr:Dihydroneopterin triphosphate diphosphatase [Trema orientale]
MISLLRKLSISLPHTVPQPKLLTKSANSFGGSQRLVAFAQQFRLYEPLDLEIKDQTIEQNAEKIVSQVGLVESAAPVGEDPKVLSPKRAAVLVCLFHGDAGDLRVILTKRSSGVSTHSGEVSLPGGKTEEGDKDEVETATREAKEEIGLDPSLVNIVTVLEPFLSKHFLRVVPVVGMLKESKAFKPTTNPAEVETVFNAPFEMFIKNENRRSEEKVWLGHKYIIHFFDYETEKEKYVIWGFTAGILIRAASVVYQRPSPFLEQNPAFKCPEELNKTDVMPWNKFN